MSNKKSIMIWGIQTPFLQVPLAELKEDGKEFVKVNTCVHNFISQLKQL